MEEVPVMVKNYVKRIGESLVREYLHNKGLEATLRCMSLEYPEREMYLYNRRELANEFGVQDLLNSANRYSVKSQKTVLEIILNEMFKKSNTMSTLALTKTSYIDKSPLSCMYNVNKQYSMIEHGIDFRQIKGLKSGLNQYCKSPCVDTGMVNASNVQPHQLTNRIKRVRPGLEAIKYFLNSVAKGKA